MQSSYPTRAWLSHVFLTLLTFSTSLWAGPKWDPIAPEDLALTECKSSPGAKAEILFVRQVLDTSGSSKGGLRSQVFELDDQEKTGWNDFYKRIKIYNPKAADELGMLAIEYWTGDKVTGQAARVTKPDGRSTEYGKKDFTESTTLKVSGLKRKRIALAVPDLEAGDIIEFRWTQGISQNIFTYYWEFCQDRVPTREYRFAVAASKNDFKIYWFTTGKAELVKSNNYSGELQIKDIPPFEDEPYSPPARDVRGWFMVLYTHPYLRWFKGTDFWKECSEYWADEYKMLTKPSSNIKARTAKLIEGAQTEEEKLSRIYDFCQSEISNISYFDTPELQAAQKRIDDSDSPQTPDETLKYKNGYGRQITQLFASMARAAGFDVRESLGASRNVTLEIMNPQGWAMLVDDFAAVKSGDRWKLYAPGQYYIPFGMVQPSNEMAKAMICDTGDLKFVTNMPSPAAASPVERKGRFTLDAEGNLEGEVEIALGGHHGAKFKNTWDSSQAEEVDVAFRERLTNQLPSAEITDLKWENLRGRTLPVIARFHLRIPGYAESAGTKMIFPPSVFTRGQQPFFTATTRKAGIFFDFAWTERDDIEITLPEGYTLDAPSSPANVGKPNETLGASYKLTWKGKLRKLGYKREFVLGGNSTIAFAAASYEPLKGLLDDIKHSDEHNLVIKPAPAAPASAVSAPAPEAAK